jgi:hypothetical protein
MKEAKERSEGKKRRKESEGKKRRKEVKGDEVGMMYVCWRNMSPERGKKVQPSDGTRFFVTNLSTHSFIKTLNVQTSLYRTPKISLFLSGT